ncbi:MAG: hypothetical protein EXQ74_02215 [Thermoleophilia bacterium]|nr:hypothetical protein [Thermoleophilia bacterium]
MFDRAYVAPPTITSASPAGSPSLAGTALTITGTGFVSGTTVTVGGNLCTSVAVVSATLITCTAPKARAPGTVNVVVTNPFGTGAATAAGAFAYRTPISARTTCKRSACITTGPVTRSATRYTQTAQIAPLTQLATGVRTGKCTVIGNKRRQTFQCTITLTKGQWSLTTAA